MKFSFKKMLSVVISVLLVFSTFTAMVAYAEEEESSSTTTTTTTTTTTAHPTNGWSKDKKRYYKNNQAVKGLIKIGSYYYFFDGNTNIIKTGWVQYKNNVYYFSPKKDTYGQAPKGLVGMKGHYYFFDGNTSALKTGWVKYRNKTYYFSPASKSLGQAVTGTATIKGAKYRFNAKGEFQYKLNDMDLKANNLSSRTNYLILVNKKTHKFAVYQGKKGNWLKIKDWKCTIGASSTPTPSGDFTIGPKNGRPFHQRYFDSGAVRCWYATRVVGGINIHSVLYTQASKPVRVSNGTLGKNLSHGCIRLKIENAKWVYDNLPKNTRCVIYSK